MKRSGLLASVAVSAMLVVPPAFANFGFGLPVFGQGSGCGLFCGKPDNNGCSVSPVTLKSCLRDLRGDVKDLKCDIVELIRDVYRGRSQDLKGDLKEISQDLVEIGYDKATIAKLLASK